MCKKKTRAWSDNVQDVRTVGKCIEKSNYAKALCSMRKVIFTIRYHQLQEDTFVKQAKRVADFL